MKDVMKHLSDDSLKIQLVRYHNTQAWDKLRELSVYIQMLLARIEKSDGRRVIVTEIEIIGHEAASIASHFRNAEMFAKDIAQEKSREVVDQTISETESIASGSVSNMRKVTS